VREPHTKCEKNVQNKKNKIKEGEGEEDPK
jgi:hypothetical protein